MSKWKLFSPHYFLRLNK